MARKNTAKANKINEPKLNVYEIGIDIGEESDIVKIQGTHFDISDELLYIHDNTSGRNVVAIFKSWTYCLCVDADFDNMKDCVYGSANNLPKEWGKVKGTDVFG